MPSAKGICRPSAYWIRDLLLGPQEPLSVGRAPWFRTCEAVAKRCVGADYIRSGAPTPINSNERRNTIWADSTNFNLAAVMALSSSLEETTRQFS